MSRRSFTFNLSPKQLINLAFGSLRVQRTQTTVASSICGMMLSRVLDVRIAFLALAVFLFHASAGVLNDIADYEADRINAPDRPLAKGIVTTKQAKVLVIGLIVSALFFAWLLSPWFFLIGVALGLPIEILYNYYLNLKNTSLGSFFYLSSSVSPIPFLVGCLVSGNLTMNTVAFAILLLPLSMCIALGSFKDAEGDRKVGKRTFVVALGEKKASQLMAALLLTSIVAYLAPVTLFSFSPVFLVLTIPHMIIRGILAHSVVSDHSVLNARRMVVIARLLIVSDHVALVLMRPAAGI